MKTLLTLLAISLLLVAACAERQASTTAETGSSVDEVESDLAEIETLEDDLNLSDLDTLDQDLNFE